MSSTFSEVYGLNKYCGPAVLSALTGKSTDQCAAVISAVSGQRVITAVQMSHLMEACKRLGFEVSEVVPINRTVFGTLMQMSKTDGRYIILVPGHVIAVESSEHHIYLIDNHTKLAINAASSARLSQPVQRIIKLTSKSRDQLQKERIEARIKWVKEQLDTLHREIEDRTRRRFEYEMELSRLEQGML